MDNIRTYYVVDPTENKVKNIIERVAVCLAASPCGGGTNPPSSSDHYPDYRAQANVAM